MDLLILDQFADYYKSKLEPQFPQVSIHAVSREEEIGDLIEKIDILMTIKITDEPMKKAAKLQWIQAMTVGVDFFLKLPSLRRDVIMTSTRGIHGPQMSEMAILLMLALNRNFPQIVRHQDQRVWERWPTRLLYQKKAGILGLGVSGQEIARKCKAFNMTVYGINRTKREIEFVDHFFHPDGLLEVIREVDYFVIVIPSTPETRNMVNAEALSSMKPTAFLVNLGRGDVVDEKALIHVLKTGKIAGAALDVFAGDPKPLAEDSPLWGMKNVIVTPRVGGMTDIYPDQILPIFEENLRRFLKGERRDLINFIEWSK
jgi:phosphoglycerate dehydrogenase-like enzyme